MEWHKKRYAYGEEMNYDVIRKVKFTLEQATKAQRGSRCIALLFI